MDCSDLSRKADVQADKIKGASDHKAMNNHAIKWLYAVPEKKKLYILALMTVQALNGASGVLYALLLRNIV